MATSGANPLDAARALASTGQPMALLYSGMRSQNSGGRSFLAHGTSATLESGGFEALEHALHHGRWFGYLGYGLRHATETLTADAAPSFIPLPDLWLMQPEHVQMWEHETPQRAPALSDVPTPPAIQTLTSNLSKPDHLEAIKRTIIQIHGGAFYQANITRKFMGEWEQAPDAFALFERLCAASPAPFSAFIQTPYGAILSSSPEGFLSVDATGKVITRPIKGTAPRGATLEADAAIRHALAQNSKDKAENLMIVDLMRNDLARSCELSSIEVAELQSIHSFATVHQMISTITAQRRADCSTLDVIRGCFPPGSMTGAPKIAAMNWCAQQEHMARGVYSGAMGWLDGKTGGCDLSVVIRTLIIQGNRFEFQVGGGIVADSDPEAEWRETMDKARGIATALGIPMKRLEVL